jgi:hypothetical protein
MGDRKPPKVEDAPGLVWRERKEGWVATWQARSDLVEKGYSPQTARLWAGSEPNAVDVQVIAANCQRMQADMHMWSRQGGYIVAEKQTNNLRELIISYQTDPDSAYHKKRYRVRTNHDSTLRRIAEKHGAELLSDIKLRGILVWYQEWSDHGRKIAMGHSFIGHLRTLFNFGSSILEDPDCERLSVVLHKRKFEQPAPRTEALSAEQATAHRAMSHEWGWPSMAIAQALQFELTLRQKDVIGEWIPISEPGLSDISHKRYGKWSRGLRWEELDDRLILRHMTSKRQKMIELNLNLADMVLEEFAKDYKVPVSKLTRAHMPAKGPMVLNDLTGYPYTASEFRRKWRIIADAAGIPKSVKNMDSRAGAITEATEAGIPLEHIKHAAAHSDINMTQRYARGGTSKIASTMAGRLEHRNKPKT